MTLKEVLKQLKSLGDEKVRAQNAKSGAGEASTPGDGEQESDDDVVEGEIVDEGGAS